MDFNAMLFVSLLFLLQYNWLWKSDKDVTYKEFVGKNPSLDEYDTQLQSFGAVEKEVEHVKSIQIIGALSLNTMHLKAHLTNECKQWKIQVRNLCFELCFTYIPYSLMKYLYFVTTFYSTLTTFTHGQKQS